MDQLGNLRFQKIENLQHKDDLKKKIKIKLKKDNFLIIVPFDN
jgi:hypothetical protein